MHNAVAWTLALFSAARAVNFLQDPAVLVTASTPSNFADDVTLLAAESFDIMKSNASFGMMVEGGPDSQARTRRLLKEILEKEALDRQKRQLLTNAAIQAKVQAICQKHYPDNPKCEERTSDIVFCLLLKQHHPGAATQKYCRGVPTDSKDWGAYVEREEDEDEDETKSSLLETRGFSQKAPDAELATKLRRLSESSGR